MFEAVAVFPVNEAVHHENDLTDLIGTVWDYMTVDELPGPNLVKLAVLVRRDDALDAEPRHQLKFYAADPATGTPPVLEQPVPGLASGQRNGIMIVELPFEREEPGQIFIWVQIDDGPAPWTTFEVRLRSQ
jgi:hypothetical protein